MAKRLTKRELAARRKAAKQRQRDKAARQREILFRRFVCPAVKLMSLMDNRLLGQSWDGEDEALQLEIQAAQSTRNVFRGLDNLGEKRARLAILLRDFKPLKL